MTGDQVTGAGRGPARRRGLEQRYDICVGGRLGDTLRLAFPGLRTRPEGGDTVLSGVFDQAALYGVLAQFEALGLELIEVRRLPSA